VGGVFIGGFGCVVGERGSLGVVLGGFWSSWGELEVFVWGGFCVWVGVFVVFVFYLGLS